MMSSDAATGLMQSVDSCFNQYYWPQTYPGITTSGFITTGTLQAPQLVRITTVELMAGYIGQVWLREEICWESKPFDVEEDARASAEKHLARALWRKS